MVAYTLVVEVHFRIIRKSNLGIDGEMHHTEARIMWI